jgi:hypothetical protein
MLATEGMNAVPVLDALIRFVSYRTRARAVDGGCLICSDNSRTFDEHSSGFLLGIVLSLPEGIQFFSLFLARALYNSSVTIVVHRTLFYALGTVGYTSRSRR